MESSQYTDSGNFHMGCGTEGDMAWRRPCPSAQPEASGQSHVEQSHGASSLVAIKARSTSNLLLLVCAAMVEIAKPRYMIPASSEPGVRTDEAECDVFGAMLNESSDCAGLRDLCACNRRFRNDLDRTLLHSRTLQTSFKRILDLMSGDQ